MEFRVLTLQRAPESIRGQLSRYMQEVRPFTFVGNLNKNIADKIWDKVCECEGIDAVFIEPDKTEQGYTVRTFNNPDYDVAEFDGLILFGKHQNVEDKLFEFLLAKTDPKKSLLAHSVEVATLAREFMLNGVLRGVFETIAKQMNVDFYDLISTVVFVIALHDIGKIHPDFQYKMAKTLSNKYLDDLEYVTFLENENLINMLYENDEKIPVCRHEEHGSDLLNVFFLEDSDFSKESYIERANETVTDLTKLAINISKIVKYHHQGKDGGYNLITDKNNNDYTWKNVQRKFYYLIKDYYKPRFFSLEGLNNKRSVDMFCHLVLSVLLICDFMSSSYEVVYDTSYEFKNTLNIDSIKEYDKLCTFKARDFMRRNCLGRISYNKNLTFNELFPNIELKRPMQQKVEEILKKYNSKEISSIFIEDECGAGKTEAGLYAILKLIASKDSLAGLYVAMPTFATAEAMLPRYKEFCKRIEFEFKPEFFAAHAMFASNEPDLEQEEMEMCMNVLYYKMLFPFAIGTIDQALRGVRNEKYNLTRFIGVMSKGLLLDEVHAYETYTSHIIKTLLKFCYMLENPVVLMSATLPRKSKKEFIKYMTGQNYEPKEAYPLVTVVFKDGSIIQEEVSCWHKGKTYNYNLVPYMNLPTEKAAHALSLAENGGNVGIILNTVDEAISVYKIILNHKKHNPAFSDLKVYLYHGRYFNDDKEKISKEIIYKFGKKGKEENARPEKAIVVATQILEQSIDIDFDYICTDIAPIDFLFQRFGRWHRHDDIGTIRELKKANYPIYIYVPNEYDFGNYGNSQYIYEKSVLEQTYNVLVKQNGSISIPNDIPSMINFVYDNAEIKDYSGEADVGNIKINHNCEDCNFSISDNFVSGDLASSRHTSYKTVQLVLADKEDYYNLLNNNWDSNLCVDLLKSRTISISKIKFDNCNIFYMDGKKLLKNHVLVCCDKKDNGDIYIPNTSIVYGEYGLIFDEDRYLVKQLEK